MEHLTKQQIVLVTLLVSFVTSIATGIVTVALMDQVPPSFTQTVNRVVEHTVERVIQTPAQPASVVKETVVVKDDDMVVAAIEANSKSLVRFVPAPSSGSGTASDAVAIGLIVTKGGLIAVDNSRLDSNATYTGIFSDGKSRTLTRVSIDKASGLSIYKTVPAASDAYVFIPAVLADSNALKLGQTIVYIAGSQTDSVQTGLISSLKRLPATGDASTTPLDSLPIGTVVTNISTGQGIGGVIADLSSDVVGYEMSSADDSTFMPSDDISSALSSYLATLTASSTAATSTTP